MMMQADEAYQIGQLGQFTPVGAYLAQDEIVRIAKERGVSMIHPGYGFLSENAEFARKVEAAGITFIGPSPEVIDSLGDKTKARQIGKQVWCVCKYDMQTITFCGLCVGKQLWIARCQLSQAHPDL